MTYVEFFDNVAVENVWSCLTNQPERLVLVGSDIKRLNKQLNVMRQIFEGRGFEIECIPCVVPENNIASAVCAIEQIIKTYVNPIFDITGGHPLFTMALGIVLQRHSDRHFQVHRFSVRNNKIYDCDRDADTIYKDAPMMSVRENILLHKGDVVFGGVDEEATYLWDLNEDFCRDIALAWEICRKDTTRWNKHVNVLSVLIRAFVPREDGVTYEVSGADLKIALSKENVSYILCEDIAKSLSNAGLITSFSVDEDRCVVVFKNRQVKRMFSKAGQVFELQTFLCATELKNSDGNSLFNDVINGVLIDWDGCFKLGDAENKEDFSGNRHKQTIAYDVDNEIDVLAMKGLVPVFISCKSGRVTTDELYKLDAVAKRFGDEYAKKVLVISSNSFGNSASPHSVATREVFFRRASDMSITIIKDMDLLSEKQFCDMLAKRIG